MVESSRVALGVRRGGCLRCPSCGEGRLFSGFLKVRRECPVCGADNSLYPADDAPPYVALVLVGHLLLPLMLWADHVYVPPMWLEFAIWLPLLTAVIVGILPYVKGAVIGFAWAMGVVRQDEPAPLEEG